MELNYLLIGLALFILLDIFLVAFIFLRKKRFPEQVRKKVLKHMKEIESQDLRHQIFEYDKLLDLCLKTRGVKGNTLGERMKTFGKMFKNTNAIWEAHKLRNTLAHEVGVNVSEKDGQKAISAFKREIFSLLK